MKYSYCCAGATKLLLYLSHILMLCVASPALGHKEARYYTEPGRGAAEGGGANTKLASISTLAVLCFVTS